jgi:hypothetical protein
VEFQLFRKLKCHFLKLLNTPYTMGFATIITYPDRERSAPVTFSADCPINDVFQEVSHAPIFDVLRIPRYCVVVTQQGVLYGSSLNKPRSPSVIEKRSVTSPTEWIGVSVFLASVKTAAGLEVFYDQRIGFFDRHPFPLRHFLGEPSFLVYQLDYRQIMLQGRIHVIFAERRGQMDYTCAV